MTSRQPFSPSTSRIRSSSNGRTALAVLHHLRPCRPADPASLGTLGLAEERAAASHRLGHRHRRGRLALLADGARRHSASGRSIRAWSSTAIATCRCRPRSVEISELTDVPGNVDSRRGERRARQQRDPGPYHERIVRELDRRAGERQPTVLVAMHSFTPVFKGVARALACRRALQSRSALRPHRPRPAAGRGRPRGRRQRALSGRAT